MPNLSYSPHQIDAALFATSNPLSKGVILADEVGLGKTIEAGLLIAQKWAERKRRLLSIVPANLRKQWHQELANKFGLPAIILEAKSFRQAVKEGCANPFDGTSANGAGNGTGSDKIVICSYQFAASKAESVKDVAWDLVVVDEAHRLRNVYPALTVKKIPKMVLQKCEWGHDDYSLNDENLPQAPKVVAPSASQASLFNGDDSGRAP